MTRARQLILGPDPVYVSLAPSWVSEFKGLPAKNMIASLKKLGFAGVGETAIGAQFLAVFFLAHQEHVPSFFSIAVAVILAILTDTMLTALLSVIRRRQIFVTKSRYLDGLPFYLVLTSLICMIVETCLYSLTGL